MPESIAGIVERVTFHNPDTGWAVLRVQSGRQRGLVTVVGSTPSIYAGEHVTAIGSWVQDRDHGVQFKAESLEVSPPHGRAAVARYLSSGLVKGIGSHFAQKIVDVFGDRTLQVIDESPSFLAEVKGIGPKRIELIRESWRQQKSVRQIMMFLQSLGVGTNRAVRIFKTYGESAIETIRANPYCLATDIWGIGFRTADEMAQKLGIPRDSPARARAAILYILKELSGEGHVGFPEGGVLEQTSALTEIEIDRLRESVAELIRDDEIVCDRTPSEPWLFLRRLHRAECGAAATLVALTRGPHPLPRVDWERAVSWAGAKMQVQLAPAQADAIRQSLRSKVLVVTGGPGVGKTTIVRGIVEIFAAKKLRVALCAPTGRAAKRLSETTGREAKTIHRLLEFDPSSGGFQHDENRPLDFDLIVADESSMIDITLFHSLVRAVSQWACLLMVGDVDQLPSVGPGSVLGDVIRSGAVPVVRLTQIFRQAQSSYIVRAAHSVNAGEMPESAPAGSGDFYYVPAETPGEIIDKILTMVRDRIPAKFGLHPLNDIQVLTPMNRSELGSRALNQSLQAALNPPGPPEVQRFGWTFRVGDKVIQTENNYQREVFNGDIGRVARVQPEDRELVVNFEGKDVSYDFDDLDELSLAYAITIHKSQGSEYPAVVVPLHTQHFLLLRRNLLYTAITRGKKLVTVVGARRALGRAVAQADDSRRYTLLAERLKQESARGTPPGNP
ncbi:MAG: ATP-dependent RecD-like DNA helicase [Gemmataceae bacterium]|nr:ATP-dependent RecD-like DNA helicase [Gemmataceae bacterium]